MNDVKEKIKDAMQLTLESLTPDNIDSQQERVNRLFHIYAELNDLFPATSPTVDTVKPATVTPVIDLASVKAAGKILSSVDVYNKIIVGPMERDLLGGTIKVKQVVVRVPEKEIRLVGYKHGDIIRADYKNMNNLLFEKLADSTTEHECKHRIVSYAVVSDNYLDGEFIAQEHYVNGAIRKIKLDGETPFTFIISDFDRQKYGIQVGDLLDFSYFENYPQTYKVVWKHSSNIEEKLALFKPLTKSEK